MSVSGGRPRRPILLLLVFGSFLALVGITASAQAAMISTHFQTATLNDVVGSDSATARAFVNAYVDPRVLSSEGDPRAAELARLEAQLATLVRPGEILSVELRRPDGTVVAATDPALRGTQSDGSPEFRLAAAGTPGAVIAKSDGRVQGASLPGATTLIREYLPLITNGQVLGVIAIARDAEPVLARLARVRGDVVVVTLSAALVAAALLFLIFRAAQGRLTRQTAALVESARLDPLSGALNHGAVVGHLAAAIETARAAGTPLGVALLDVDNFRLLNDNHGHRGGDDALLAVIDLLRPQIAEGVVVGRYGPDEFLLVAPAELVTTLEPTLERLRTSLADFSLQFEATERIPVTISAGLCTYPDHGSSVTVLLSAVARILEDAKASGGDAIRVAGPPAAGDTQPARASGFDVLKGLVLAVDTKDRYTMRHSEDVARYSVFIATELGLDAELIRTIGVAGLLHDVGKIGIPDDILRKPGRLTADETEVVKQHVALGDLIVRDLPDIEVVRAGIRHHHERWDGAGYLHRLEGEEIPLIARILAVSDAFSAMTTTRPYRKALDVAEALRRLEDASGSQLEERLVRAFIGAVETHRAPPLPGDGGGLAAVLAPVVAAGLSPRRPKRRVA